VNCYCLARCLREMALDFASEPGESFRRVLILHEARILLASVAIGFENTKLGRAGFDSIESNRCPGTGR
jgi:hypothetical protein